VTVAAGLCFVDHPADFSDEGLIRSTAGTYEIGPGCNQARDEFSKLPGGGAKDRLVVLGYFR